MWPQSLTCLFSPPGIGVGHGADWVTYLPRGIRLAPDYVPGFPSLPFLSLFLPLRGLSTGEGWGQRNVGEWWAGSAVTRWVSGRARGGWVQGAKTAEEVLHGLGSEAQEAKRRLGPTPEDVSSRARVRSRTQPPSRDEAALASPSDQERRRARSRRR